VTTSQEAGLLGADDEEQAAFGLSESRVVVTHDPDFLRLQASGIPHAGIVYRGKDTLSLGQITKRLVLIWEICEPQELADRVEFLYHAGLAAHVSFRALTESPESGPSII
jgi:hypothetical protein